jgi:hypothetical protein
MMRAFVIKPALIQPTFGEATTQLIMLGEKISLKGKASYAVLFRGDDGSWKWDYVTEERAWERFTLMKFPYIQLPNDS